MQYTKPIKTEGRKQKRIKQELKPVPSRQGHRKTKITLRSQHFWSGSQNTNIEAHWIPTSISHTEIKTMPKPLTIARGSLYKRAGASCNKSLGSSRKWKNNMKREEGGRKKKKKKKISYCSRAIILSQYSKSPPLFPLKEWASIKLALPHAGFQEQFKIIPWLLSKILNPISFGQHFLKKSKRWPM